eukprot:5171964-Amphidinium_carterae.1
MKANTQSSSRERVLAARPGTSWGPDSPANVRFAQTCLPEDGEAVLWSCIGCASKHDAHTR